MPLSTIILRGIRHRIFTTRIQLSNNLRKTLHYIVYHFERKIVQSIRKVRPTQDRSRTYVVFKSLPWMNPCISRRNMRILQVSMRTIF